VFAGHRLIPGQGGSLSERISGPPADSAEALEALDTAACGLLRTAADGTILRANRLFCQWFGYAANDLVGRRRFQDLLTMGGRVFHQTHWTPLLQMQQSISEVKLAIADRGGVGIPIVVNALRGVDRGVEVHDIAVYIARDRDKYERELVQSQKRLEALVAQGKALQAEARDRAVFAEQMMGIVSHDLRNPLSTILMGTVVLGRGELSAGQQRALARIASATERAKRLISDLLDFTQARLGAGLAVTPEPIDLHEMIAEALQDLRLAFPARTLIHQRVGSGACVADGNRLAQLVGNLVSNAMAYGASDAPVTVITAVAASAFTISVHNQGPPIPAEALPTLFQPMSRGSDAGRVSRSVGLGLYIVHEIARAHGGRTSVTSVAGEGTTFTTVIPQPPGTSGAADAC
jgi:phosphoserine phosphatase RsbU/P